RQACLRGCQSTTRPKIHTTCRSFYIGAAWVYAVHRGRGPAWLLDPFSAFASRRILERPCAACAGQCQRHTLARLSHYLSLLQPPDDEWALEPRPWRAISAFRGVQ